MVVAQIGVGEDIIADRLAGAKAAAMADHQPSLRAKHSDMVADRLGVGRPDADIDQGDAVAVRRHQMIGRHLVPPPDAGGDLLFGVGQVAMLVDSAGDRQAGEGLSGVAQRGDREADELIDIADVVGEQHEVLEMLGRRAGVMLQPGEAEIGARRIEKRQRPDAVGAMSQTPSAISSPIWTSSVEGNQRDSSAVLMPPSSSSAPSIT